MPQIISNSISPLVRPSQTNFGSGGLLRPGRPFSHVSGRSNVAEQVGSGLAKACRSSDVAVAGDSDESRAGGHTPAQRQKELRRRDGEVTPL